MPDAWAMDFDSKVVSIGVASGQRRQMLTVAKANLKDARSLAAKNHVELQGLRRELDPVQRPELGERARLTGCGATRA
jgi:hypothetical protein